MSKCIRKAGGGAWCGENSSGEMFASIDEAAAVSGAVLKEERRSAGHVCTKCATMISCALRGPDPEIDVEMHEGLFRDTVMRADPLVSAMPTCDRVVGVSATLMQVAAFIWLRFRQPEDLRDFIPLNEERFSRLAGSIYLSAEQAMLARNN